MSNIYSLQWRQEDNVWYCYAYFEDATYRIRDNPVLSEGFPSTDVFVNAEYIRTRWEKIEQLYDCYTVDGLEYKIRCNKCGFVWNDRDGSITECQHCKQKDKQQ